VTKEVIFIIDNELSNQGMYKTDLGEALNARCLKEISVRGIFELNHANPKRMIEQLAFQKSTSAFRYLSKS
jgi:hypothetical protein